MHLALLSWAICTHHSSLSVKQDPLGTLNPNLWLEYIDHIPASHKMRTRVHAVIVKFTCPGALTALLAVHPGTVALSRTPIYWVFVKSYKEKIRQIRKNGELKKQSNMHVNNITCTLSFDKNEIQVSHRAARYRIAQKMRVKHHP